MKIIPVIATRRKALDELKMDFLVHPSFLLGETVEFSVPLCVKR
jgi:hypothetical protein